jgi:predicted nucleic acid-binding Zn ribbon protein
MARNTYQDVLTHCVVCTQPVPEDRATRGGVTCSAACLAVRKAVQRAQRDAKECRYCRKPSTLAARAAFRRFRHLEETRPDILYPKQFAEWKATLTPDVAPSAEGFVAFLEASGMITIQPWLGERAEKRARKQAEAEAEAESKEEDAE